MDDLSMNNLKRNEGEFQEDILQVINNTYDYSNVLARINDISFLAEYLSKVFSEFNKLVEEDEEANKRYRQEYRRYMYKKNYGTGFEVYFAGEECKSTICNDIESFKSLISNGGVRNIRHLQIKLNLNYGRGSGFNISNHENSFIIEFRPYDIKFLRKSNYKDSNMDYIESSIINILNQFKAENTIFCSK